MLASVSFDQLRLDSNGTEFVLKRKKVKTFTDYTNFIRKQVGSSKIILELKLKEL